MTRPSNPDRRSELARDAAPADRSYIAAVKVRLLRPHRRDGIALLAGTEITVSVAEADFLMGRGMAVEVCLIQEEH